MAAIRWRAFANIVAGALGVNVWVSLVLLPAISVGAARGAPRILALALPVLVLAVGLRRRSETILLGAFPAALVVPLWIEPQLALSSVNDIIRMGFVATGTIAYLLGAAFFTTFHEPAAPISVRKLSSALAGPAPRWQRRERLYWELTALAIVVPAVLIAWVHHDEAVAASIGAAYPGHIAKMTTAMSVGALVLWLGIYHYAFLGVLRPHRTGDRDLVETFGATRSNPKTGALRTRFYGAVVLALLAMATLVAVRVRG